MEQGCEVPEPWPLPGLTSEGALAISVCHGTKVHF